MRRLRLIKIITLSTFCVLMAFGCGQKGPKKKRPVDPNAQAERDGGETSTLPPFARPNREVTDPKFTPPAGEPQEQTPEVVEAECEDKTRPECLTEEEKAELEEREQRAAETAEDRLEGESEETTTVDPEVQKRQILADFIQAAYERGNLVDAILPSLASDANFRVLSKANFRSLRLKNQSLNSYCYRNLCPLVTPLPQRVPASQTHNIVLPPELSVRFTHKDLWSEIFEEKDGEDVPKAGRHFVSLGNSIVAVMIQPSNTREAKIIVDEQLIGYQVAMGYHGDTHHLVVVSDQIRTFEVFEQVANNRFQRYELQEPSYSKLGQLTVSYGRVDDIEFVNSVPMGLWESDLLVYKIHAEQTRIAAKVEELDGPGDDDKPPVDASLVDREHLPDDADEGPGDSSDVQEPGDLVTEEDGDLVRQEVPNAAIDTAGSSAETIDRFGRFFVGDIDIQQIQCIPLVFDEVAQQAVHLHTVLNFFPTESFRSPEFDKLDGAQVEDLQNELPYTKFPDGTPMTPFFSNGTLKLVSHDESNTILEVLDQEEGKQAELKFEKREDAHYVGVKRVGDEKYHPLLVCVSSRTAIRAGYVQHPEVPADRSSDMLVPHRVRYSALEELDVFALLVHMRIKTSGDDPYSVKDGQVYKDSNPVELASGDALAKETWDVEMDATGVLKIMLPDGTESAPFGERIQVKFKYSEDETDGNITFSQEVLADPQNAENMQRILEGLDLDNREEDLHMIVSEGTDLCVQKSYVQIQRGIERPFIRREVLGTCFGRLTIQVPKDSPIEVWRGERKLFGPVEVNQE